MERKSTTVTEEFDKNGILLTRTTETVEEKDDGGYIYPHTTTPWQFMPKDFLKKDFCKVTNIGFDPTEDA